MTRTLLVVDDIRSNREILKNMLGKDYRIIEAEDGQEALAVMAREYQHISAVLLDLGMPVMDGYDVLSCMQKDEKLSQLPVIVTTGQTDAGSEEKALKLGARDYISKPYKSAIIRQRIWNTIDLRETAATVNALQRDRLTGLYSRDAFFEKVREMVSGHGPSYYTMACFDVDKFKVINDQYGTDKGDDVLRHIAQVFQSGFEPHGGICCRLSADDFAVFYPTSFQDSLELGAVRRRASVVAGLATPLAFSIGRYVVRDITLSPSAMYDRAVLAADSVRGRYDSRIGQYSETMRDQLLHEQEIVMEMESALHEGQFTAWYQPQYNHSTGALIGAEALVRWNHPQRGLIPPGAFVPVFEQNGFIYALDKYVWERVCQYLRREIDAGRSPLPVSVNISRYDVFRPDFFESITALIAQYDIPAGLLRLEITESAFAESTEHIVSMVKQLIAFGFTLEIDDFGSGYSSLNTLKNVPAQVVKLDMRFLEDDDGSQRGGNIIESIVRMTKWLGMSVIAEGVERKTQADYLKSIGCSYVQGYLYAKPMPEEEYRALCAKADKEEKLLVMEAVENLDNNAFWDPDSMDTLIFNSYVGAACVYEYHKGKIELLRASEKYAQFIGGAGMSVEDALKLNWANHLGPEDHKRLLEDLDRSVQTRQEVMGEYIFLDLPGCAHETYLRSTMRVIASAGNRYLVYCTNENITAQREAERRERQLAEQMKAVMDNVACGITAVTIQGETVNYILTNDKYYTLLGYTKEQYLAEVGTRAFVTIYPGDVDRVMEVVSRVRDTGEPVTMEYRAVRRDGGMVWLRSNVSMGAFAGVQGMIQLSTYTDITEQKQAELELLDTTAQLKAMMDDMPGGFSRIRIAPDGSMKRVFINAGFCKLLGMDHDELVGLYGHDAFKGVHPDDYATLQGAITRALATMEAQSLRYRLQRSNGDYILLNVFFRVTRDAAEETYLNVYYTDASEQAQREAQQRELLDNLPYGVALYEYAGGALSVIHLNKRYWELVDRSEKAYAGLSFVNAVYEQDRGIIAQELQAAIREKRDVACDVRILYGKGEYRPFHIVGRVLERGDGRYSIYAVYTPISDEVMSVQEMLPIALSAMMDYQKGYTFVKDKALRYICCSRDAAALMGLSSPAEIVGKSDQELFDKSLADAFVAADRRVLEKGEAVLDYTVCIPSGDGADHYANTSKFPLRDSKGNIIGIYGYGEDVTEAHTMRSQFELLTNSIPGGIATYEYRAGTLHITYFSDGFCKLFEVTREEYAVRSAADVFAGVYERDMPKLRAGLEALVQGGEQADCVYRVHLRSGAYKWINLKASIFQQDEDKTVFHAVLFDVTQRQEDMERIRISEEENRLAMQHTQNAVCRYNVASRTLRIPREAQKTYFLPAEVENVPYGPIARGLVSSETADAYKAFYEDILHGKENGAAAYQRKSAQGWRWLEAHFSTIFSDAGDPVSAVVSFLDITEQLEKDSAYIRYQQSMRDKDTNSYSLFRCSVNRETSFDTAEGGLLRIKFKPGPFMFDEHTAQYVSEFVLEEDQERFTAFLNVDSLLSGYYQGKHIVSLEYREKLPEEGYRWLRLTVDLVEHDQLTDIEAYMLFEDIDKAKRFELVTLEQAKTDPLTGVMNRSSFVAQVNNLIHTAKSGTQHALMMLDIDGFKQVNDAFGHGAGDQALIDVATALRTALRHGDLVGRLGGDEFAVFLTDVPGDVIVARKAQQICALMRKSFSAEVEISGSLGIALTPRDGTDFDVLYKKADAALYHVKGSGKDSYAFYHEDMANQHLVLERQKTVAKLGAMEPRRKRRMLIVDDSRIDHVLLANIFADQFIIEKAKDGPSALIRLRHYGSAISVVLLDLVMPGMDGFAVLKKIQESQELRNIPVIVVSGDDERETGLRAIREGAVDFVNKPVDPEILRIRVQSAVSKAENERLRAKNSFLEYQSNAVLRYRMALEHNGIVVVENDWVAGTFLYDQDMGEHIAGTYDTRTLWHILLSDLVAETVTVQRMQGLVHEITMDRTRTGAEMLAQLKTPSGARHWFRMSVYKLTNEFGLAGKIYMTFSDLGMERPTGR